MAKLSTTNANSTLTFLAGSKYWKFYGIDITAHNPLTYAPNLASNNADGSVTYGLWPDHITFDCTLWHPYENDAYSPYRGVERGAVIDGSNITYTNSSFYDFTGYLPPSIIASITGATNASPVVVTTTGLSNPGHAFFMNIVNATGSWAGLNGLKIATYIDSTHASLQNYDQCSFALSNLDSTGFGSFSGQTPSRTDNVGNSSIPINLVSGPGPYTITNNLIEGYYSQFFSGGGNTSWIPTANVVTVSGSPAPTNRTATLSGVGNLAVGDLIVFKTMQPQTISAVTNANPAVLTVPAHIFPVGTKLYGSASAGVYFHVSGFTGSWTPLNGNFFSATVIDSTHISVPVDSTSFGAVTGTPVWVPFSSGATLSDPAVDNWSVGQVTSISGNNITWQFKGNNKGTGFSGGNGAGTAPAVGTIAQFNGLTPDSITINHNIIQIRHYWLQLYRDIANTCLSCGYSPKAVWESKSATHVSLTGNIIQDQGNTNPAYGPGNSLGMNVANQIGATPWVSDSHWLVQNNIWKGYTYLKVSLNQEYLTGVTSNDWVLDNNLYTSAMSPWVSMESGDGVHLTHNTVRNQFGSGNFGAYNAGIICSEIPNTTFLTQDNIWNWQLYGYDMVAGNDSQCWAGITRNHEFLIDDQSQNFTPPTGDTRVATVDAMQFLNYLNADSGGDYHGYQLLATSPGHNAASDGTDAGVNFATLDTALGTLANHDYMGWGANTPGGSGQPTVHVINLNDSGIGSFRQAVSAGNRNIVFDVSGTINLLSDVVVGGSFITINGSGVTAGTPGITFANAAIRFDSGIHDIILTYTRHRTCGVNSVEGDCITIKNGIYNMVVDHVSTDGPTDGNIDITNSSHDITVQWSILSNGLKAMLLNYGPLHISLHNNIWYGEQNRSPNVQWNDASTSVASDTQADFENNIVYNWGNSGRGSVWQCGGIGNDINNYYFSGASDPTRKAMGIVNDGCTGGTAQPLFYTTGNISGDDSSSHLNIQGTVFAPYAAPQVGTQSTCNGAKSTKSGAGDKPADATDTAVLAALTLTGCP